MCSVICCAETKLSVRLSFTFESPANRVSQQYFINSSHMQWYHITGCGRVIDISLQLTLAPKKNLLTRVTGRYIWYARQNYVTSDVNIHQLLLAIVFSMQDWCVDCYLTLSDIVIWYHWVGGRNWKCAVGAIFYEWEIQTRAWLAASPNHH